MTDQTKPALRTRAARVVVPVLKPDTSASRRDHDEAEARLRLHLICVTFAVILSVMTTFVSGGILIHMMPAVPVLPSGVQEVLDRIFGL